MGLEELDNLDNLDEFFPSETEALSGPSSKQRELDFFRHIPVKVTLEVASAELPLGDLMQLHEGTVIKLDKQAGESLDLKVNGRSLAKGEVVVVNGAYGIRITAIEDPEAGLLSGLGQR